MMDPPPYEESTGVLRKIYEIGFQLDLLGAIVGVEPDVHLRCHGDPAECGTACTKDTCPLRSNRLQEIGDMAAVLLEEFRWHRAFAEELEALRVVPKGTLERVQLRVQKVRLIDHLKEAIQANEALTGVQVLRERFVSRISQIRADIETIDTQLDGSEGVKA